MDDKYTDITTVIDHKLVLPNSKQRTRIQFLLTQKDDSESKWYPWSATLGRNGLIHEYMNNKRVRRHILTKYTHPKDHLDEIAHRQEMRNERNNNINNNKRKRKRN